MEDIKSYIESGILELYVLGDVSPEEKAQVEAMAAKHPSIKAELEEIAKSLEQYARANEVEPREGLRERTLNSLLVNFNDDRIFGGLEKETDTKIVSFEPRRQNDFYKYAFAAAVVLLIVSTAALVVVYDKLKDSQNQVANLAGRNEKIAGLAHLMDSELKVFRDPSFKIVRLNGTAKSPDSHLVVAFSPSRKKVMIDMSDADMPVTDKEHQYQLWALVAGKPVDLGVFDTDTATSGMKYMKEIASADAFAVTLEKRGGSPTPTLDKMMVLGKF